MSREIWEIVKALQCGNISDIDAHKSLTEILERNKPVLALIAITPASTKLDDQIAFAKTLCIGIQAPMTAAIYNSLKELKGIKQKTIPTKSAEL